MQNLCHICSTIKPTAPRFLKRRAKWFCLQLVVGLLLLPQQAMSQNTANPQTLELSEAVSLALASVVIGGIILSTLLTLFVTPALYRILHKDDNNKSRTEHAHAE